MRAALAFPLLASLVFSALAVLAASACVTRDNAAAQNAIDVTVAPVGAVPHTEITSSGEPSGDGRCTLTLTASAVETLSSGCTPESHVSRLTGTLAYPCSGSGPAEADFGDEHYAGKIEDGRLSLERKTELDWDDGCRWSTHAMLEGTLSKGKPLPSQNVAWTYFDRVVTGDACSGVCRAHANIEASARPGSRKVDGPPAAP